MQGLGGVAAPVVLLGAGAVVVLLLDLFWEGAAGLLRGAALVVLAAAAAAALAGGGLPAAFHGAVLGGTLARVTDLVAIAGAVAATVLPAPLGWGRRWSAYLALVLWSAAGMALAGAAGNLIVLFLGIEVLSLALYVLTAFALHDGRGAEAGFKYFVLGGLGSGLLLYGAALSYAATGSLAIGPAVRGAGHGPLGAVGLALLVAGLAFKLALAPMQLWTADVYEGAPTPITAFMAVGTKAAAFAALARVAAGALGLSGPFAAALLVSAVVSMFVGYLLALRQPGLKRLLAFSGIANAGTLVLALLVPAIWVSGKAASCTCALVQGLQAPPAWEPVALLYLIAYAVASLGVFAVVAAVGDGRSADGMASLAGLGRRHPWLTAAFVICLLSLAGVPPTGGFLAKLWLLQLLTGGGRPLAAVLVVVATLVALVPYFKLVVAALQPDDGEPAAPLPTGVALVAGLAAVATVAIGILPGAFLHG